MKQAISLFITTLFIGNVAFANSTDNNLSDIIEQKVAIKKSNLGANVQTNSGLSHFNKHNSHKDNVNNNDLKEINKDNLIENTNSLSQSNNQITNKINDQKNKELTVNKNISIISSPSKNDDMTNNSLRSEVNNNSNKINHAKNLNSVDNNTIKKEEICDPLIVKTEIKNHKKVIKKNTININKNTNTNIHKSLAKSIKQPFEFNKVSTYQPSHIMNSDNVIHSQQVQFSVLDNINHLEIFMSDDKGNIINKEQFSTSFLRVVQISQNFNIITHQEKDIHFSNNAYIFNKDIKNCSAIFIQYQLKNSLNMLNYIKYTNSQGILSDTLDSSCNSKLPEDLATNLNYSSNNNISGLFFKNDKLLSSQPTVFHIVFTKNGITRTPNDLFVYAVKTDFSDLSVMSPKSYGNAVSGILFEKKFDKGNYILGYSFKEGQVEHYLKNIHVQ